MLDNVKESKGLFLKVATDEVSFGDIAKTFTAVTGKKASHIKVPLEGFAKKAEPYPDAPANFAAGPDAHRDEASMTWVENFTPWWRYWGGQVVEKRDFKLLDKIHPNRIKSLQEWMEKNKYDGTRRNILKNSEDLKRMAEGQKKAGSII